MTWVFLALLAPAASAPADEQLARMAALYEEVCLKDFPDDRAVEAAMRARNAAELTPDEVKVTFRDDPGQAWKLEDEGATVWLEFPPYHACSVRWNASEIGDLSSYRSIALQYEKQRGGFAPMDSMEADAGDFHIHGTGEWKFASGIRESLLVIDQHITNPKRRAAGETGFVLRLVHQFAPAKSK